MAYMKMICPHDKGEPLYDMEPEVFGGNLVTASSVSCLELRGKY